MLVTGAGAAEHWWGESFVAAAGSTAHFPPNVEKITPPELYVGILSGTSVDRVDATLVAFEPAPRLVAAQALEFPADLRRELLALATPGESEIDRLGQADSRLAELLAEAVNGLLRDAGVAAGMVRAIGSHGQTIRHRPGLAPAFTLQIGDPNIIATRTGIPVVADFRRKDMALGGQGAPLVPAFHEAVFRTAGRDRVVVNLGGIANLTLLPGDPAARIGGFDTGPGNTLLDAWARRVLGEPMDRDGTLAARGHVIPELLEVFLADPFFRKNPPKSTGPEHFSLEWLQERLTAANRAGEADVQATLVALTAQTIAAAIRQTTAVQRPEVFVCGGGARNPALMAALRKNLSECTVETTAGLGVDPDWVEAMAFAWLARQRLESRPGNHPSVTGARRAAILGGLYLPG